MHWEAVNVDTNLTIGDRKVAISVSRPIRWKLPVSDHLSVHPGDNDIWVWKVNSFAAGGPLQIVPPDGGRLLMGGSVLPVNQAVTIPTGKMAVLVPTGLLHFAISILD